MAATETPPAAPGSVAVVLGTRPEIIKLAPVVLALGPAARIIHTGQHFDSSLSQVFFDAFGLPAPTVELAVGGATRGAQIGRATDAIDAHLRSSATAAVVVQGDTNSALAGALAANACEIPLVHVEAGLRSFDRLMPEEHNRVLIDHLADVCAAPTEVNRENLEAERIPADRIRVTGNPIVEAVATLLPDSDARGEIRRSHDIPDAPFVLSTFHRPENVDDPATLRTVLAELAALELPVVLPLHPRTRAGIEADPIAREAAAAIRILDPIPYGDFLGLMAEAAILVADSGGLQEEASILKRPILVVRRSTERPEVIGTFARRVLPGAEIGAVVADWASDLDATLARLVDLPSPYGDGHAGERIATLTLEAADA